MGKFELSAKEINDIEESGFMKGIIVGFVAGVIFSVIMVVLSNGI